MSMLQVSIGKDGTLYGINDQLGVYKYTEGWVSVDPDFRASYISVGDKSNVWAVNYDGHHTSYLDTTTNTFKSFGGSLSRRVSVGIDDASQVWIIGTDAKTYKLENDKFIQTPSGAEAKEISVYDSTTVWIIGTDAKTYELQDDKFIQTPPGSEGIQISVDANKEVWLIGTNFSYYKLVGAKFASISAIPWTGSGLNTVLAYNQFLATLSLVTS